MDDNVGAPFDRTAKDRRGKGVVNNQRHAVLMRDAGKLFNVADRERGIGERLGKDGLRIGLEGLLQRFLIIIFINKDAFDAHPLHRHRKQIDRASVDLGSGNEAVACGQDVKQRHKARRLPRGRQQAADAAFESGQLLFNICAGGVGNA